MPAIRRLEKAARRDFKDSANAKDIVTRVPKGLETPNYTVLSQRSKFEVRRYEPFTVCTVSMNQPRPKEAERTDTKVSNPQLAGAGAFGALAGYLFGKNEESTSMKMTTPVLSSGSENARQMSFVLPSVYWNKIDKAPAPLQGSGVQLEQKNGGERAVVMFGGFAGKKDVETRTQLLLRDLSKDKEWARAQDADVVLAQYNDPFTPPWQRRNEVSVAVIPRE